MRRSYQFSGAGKLVKMGPAGLIVCLLALGAGCNNTDRPKGTLADPLFGTAPGPTANRPTGNAATAPVPSGNLSNAALVNPGTGQPYAYNGNPPPGGYAAGQPTGWPPPAQPGQYGQPNYSAPYPPGPPPYANPAQPGPPGYSPNPPYANPAAGQPPYPPNALYPPNPPLGTPINPSTYTNTLTAVPVGQPTYPPPNQPPGTPITPPAYPNAPTAVPVGQPTYPAAPVTTVGYMPGQRIVSYDQAQTYLASLGTKYQRLESGDGEWRFTCSIPNRNNPAISRTYEGRATSYLAAVQAVLDQINQDRP